VFKIILLLCIFFNLTCRNPSKTSSELWQQRKKQQQKQQLKKQQLKKQQKLQKRNSLLKLVLFFHFSLF
jgi:predicted KAP-like P-loop ATPase